MKSCFMSLMCSASISMTRLLAFTTKKLRARHSTRYTVEFFERDERMSEMRYRRGLSTPCLVVCV